MLRFIEITLKCVSKLQCLNCLHKPNELSAYCSIRTVLVFTPTMTSPSVVLLSSAQEGTGGHVAEHADDIIAHWQFAAPPAYKSQNILLQNVPQHFLMSPDFDWLTCLIVGCHVYLFIHPVTSCLFSPALRAFHPNHHLLSHCNAEMLSVLISKIVLIKERLSGQIIIIPQPPHLFFPLLSLRRSAHCNTRRRAGKTCALTRTKRSECTKSSFLQY